MMRLGKPSRETRDDPHHYYGGGCAEPAQPEASSPRHKRNPFRWRKEEANGLLGSQSARSNGYYDSMEGATLASPDVIDPLLVEMDVSNEEESSFEQDEEIIQVADIFTRDQSGIFEKSLVYNGHPRQKEDTEDTEALSLSVASGLALSTATSDSLENSSGHNPATTEDSKLSPTTTNRKQPKLRFSSLQGQIAKTMQRKSAQETSSARPSQKALSPRRWSKKLAEVASPLKDRRFHKMGSAGGDDFEIHLQQMQQHQLQNEDEEAPLERQGLQITFPNLEIEDTQQLPKATHGSESIEEADWQDDDDSHEASSVKSEGKDVTVDIDVEATEESVETYYPPLPLKGSRDVDEDCGQEDRNETSADTSAGVDIILDGFPECWDGHENGLIDSPKVAVDSKEVQEVNDIESPGIQSPTKMRSALHRLGRLKKKVTKKLKKLETQDAMNAQAEEEADESPGTDKAKTNWAEKITKIAANSARTVQMAASSVQPLSPLKARKGRKIERLDSQEEFPSISLHADVDSQSKGDATNFDHVDSEAREELPGDGNTIQISDTATLRKDPSSNDSKSLDVSGASFGGSNQDCQTDADSDDEASQSHLDAAPDGTVWVRSSSGCVQHLEISFEYIIANAGNAR